MSATSYYTDTSSSYDPYSGESASGAGSTDDYSYDIESGSDVRTRSAAGRGITRRGGSSTKSTEKRGFKAQLVDIAWRGLTYSVPIPKTAKANAERSEDSRVDPKTGQYRILRGCDGLIEAGQTCCLLGASGAGKTTLLNYISGRLVSGTKGGEVTINGEVASASLFREVSAYVTQDDIVPELLTAREAIAYSADLRLVGYSAERKNRIVDGLIKDLGLTHCKDTRVGTPGLTRGLSGGERKRVNIACSMVTPASVLFLDEPTSGLDSRTALNVIEQMRRLAKRRGMTVLATVHQPSKAILDTFDKVIVLAEGKIVFSGRPDDLIDHFDGIGFPFPKYSNPADEVMSLLTVDGAADAAGRERVGRIIAARPRDTVDLRSSNARVVPKKSATRSAFAHQFRTLLSRNFVTQFRNPMLTRARFGQTLVFAVLVGLLYFQIGDGQTSVQGRQGALFIIAANMLITSVIGVLFTFPQERAIFLRERSDGAYSTFAYFAAKVAADVPLQIVFPAVFSAIVYWLIGFQADVGKFFQFTAVTVLLALIGSALGFVVSGATGDVSLSLSIAPGLFMPMLLFSGFLVNLDTMTSILSWIRFLNPIKYAFAVIALNEFRGLEFTCSEDAPETSCIWKTGEQIIESLNLEDDTDEVWVNFVLLIVLAVVLRIAGYVAILLSTRSKIPK